MGKESTNGDIDLVNFFIDALIDFGFSRPCARRRRPVADSGQRRPPPEHPHLAGTDQAEPETLTGCSRRSSSTLASAACLIRDIDLFRGMSPASQQPHRSVYHLVKQISRLLPVFLTISAPRAAADVSTRIDELSQRRMSWFISCASRACREQQPMIPSLRRPSSSEDAREG